MSARSSGRNSGRNGGRAGAGKVLEIASYEEVLANLTVRMREGDVRATIALAGHLKPSSGQSEQDRYAARRMDELAAARIAKGGR